MSLFSAINLLPADMIADYRLAHSTAPFLIANETDPIVFFRCEKGNPWSAAKRLALHWSLRREVFGEDRWLRKMDLSGTGAMGADDIYLLHSGIFALTSYTRPVSGRHNQQALLVNFSRLNGRDPGPSRHRVFMFLMYSLNAYTQENGLIVLMSLPGSGVRVRSDNGKMLKESYRSQMFWVRRIFLIHDPNDSRQMLVRTFAAMIASLVRRVLNRVPEMIVAPDRATAMSILRSHAIDPQLVPEHLGGLWSYDLFDAWLDDKLRKEGLACDDSSNNIDTLPVIGTSLILQASQDLQTQTRRPLPAHVTRLRNSATAKHRYTRRKNEMEALLNHTEELRRQNTALQKDNTRLEILIDQAVSWIENASVRFSR